MTAGRTLPPSDGENLQGGSGFSHSCFLPGFSDQPGGFRSFSDPYFLFISLISLCFPWLANPGKTEKNPGKLGKTWKKKQAPGKSTQTQEPQVLHLVPATCPETERCQGTMSFTIDGGAEGKAGGVCPDLANHGLLRVHPRQSSGRGHQLGPR